jgi:hypothetical protein
MRPESSYSELQPWQYSWIPSVCCLKYNILKPAEVKPHIMICIRPKRVSFFLLRTEKEPVSKTQDFWSTVFY